MLDALAAYHRRAAGPVEESRVRAVAGETLTGLRRLGEVTGALHGALASATEEAAFVPEIITRSDLVVWTAAVRGQLDAARAVADRAEIPRSAAGVEQGLEGLLGRWRIRHHGDLHLGQVLRRETDGDFVILDFEGEPLRPLAERRAKHAAVRDVAGVLRSIAYAAAASLPRDGGERERQAWADAWESKARQAFLDGYRSVTTGARFLPETEGGFTRAVAVFELEKAAYEVVYEANNRPDWIGIPLAGVARAATRLDP
jgi:predicted trehalose synthase